VVRLAARALHVDAALAAALGFRIWQGVSGVVTILLVGRLFSIELQGIYYTFLSVVAFQTLSDLGLFLAIISVASHEWAALRLEPDGGLAGDDAARSRLISLGRRTAAVYAVGGVLSGVTVWAVGVWFFSHTVGPAVSWHGPWSALVAASTLTLLASPFVALLEGCGQVSTVNRYRLVGAVTASAAAWAMMATGSGLWALPAAAACVVARDAILVAHRYRRFFSPFRRPAPGPRVHWLTEVWPMQWRLGLQGVSQFGSTLLFNPILLYYHSAAEAGRFGMTWAAVVGLQTIALAWIQTRVPTLGHLAARRDVEGFEQVWRHAALRSVSALAAGGAGLCVAIALLGAVDSPFAQRVLSPSLTALLVLGTCAAQVVQCLAAYLRATKRELLLPVGVSSSLAAGVLGWVLGRTAGPAGLVAAYGLAMGGLALPLAAAIWSRHRLADWPSRGDGG